MTQLELEEVLTSEDEKVTSARNIVMIQCVGSRNEERPYCSRICCNKTIELALELKKVSPNINIFVLYRDMRTYGFMEDAYREARQKGAIFVRYTPENKPIVENTDTGELKVRVNDNVLGEELIIDADLVVLAAAIVPTADNNERLAKLFKIPLNEDGFFLEAHMKLRPVDFSTEGVFMCGLAHGPKSLEENIAQAKAAAGRACTVLSKNKVEAEGKLLLIQKKKWQLSTRLFAKVAACAHLRASAVL